MNIRLKPPKPRITLTRHLPNSTPRTRALAPFYPWVCYQAPLYAYGATPAEAYRIFKSMIYY